MKRFSRLLAGLLVVLSVPAPAYGWAPVVPVPLEPDTTSVSTDAGNAAMVGMYSWPEIGFTPSTFWTLGGQQTATPSGSYGLSYPWGSSGYDIPGVEYQGGAYAGGSFAVVLTGTVNVSGQVLTGTRFNVASGIAQSPVLGQFTGISLTGSNTVAGTAGQLYSDGPTNAWRSAWGPDSSSTTPPLDASGYPVRPFVFSSMRGAAVAAIRPAAGGGYERVVVVIDGYGNHPAFSTVASVVSTDTVGDVSDTTGVVVRAAVTGALRQMQSGYTYYKRASSSYQSETVTLSGAGAAAVTTATAEVDAVFAYASSVETVTVPIVSSVTTETPDPYGGDYNPTEPVEPPLFGGPSADDTATLTGSDVEIPEWMDALGMGTAARSTVEWISSTLDSIGDTFKGLFWWTRLVEAD